MSHKPKVAKLDGLAKLPHLTVTVPTVMQFSGCIDNHVNNIVMCIVLVVILVEQISNIIIYYIVPIL